MRYRIKEYAKALSDFLDNFEFKEKNLIGNFIRLLEKNGELKNANKIIEFSERYNLEKRGNKKIVLETARKIEMRNLIKSILKKGDMIQERINPDIIAGIKIIVNNEKQLDFSLSKKLNEIFSSDSNYK